MKKIIKYQWALIFLMKFMGLLGVAGVLLEGHPYISTFILATAGGLSELNTYVNESKNN